MASRCTQRWGKKANLPHRFKVTKKILPAFDNALDIKVKGKVMGLAKLTGIVITSDGWSSVQIRPIVNAVASLPAGGYFLEAIDTSGETKDAKFISDFVVKHINSLGKDMVLFPRSH